MKFFRTKINKLSGTEFKEVFKNAFSFYQNIKSGTKRRPYVRSIYFNKEKIFLDIFWQHLFGKPNWRDRLRRLKYFIPAIELLRYTKFEPKSKENPNNRSEILHRFAGMTPSKDLFFVQVKEEKRTGQKFLISVFTDE